MSSVCTRCGSPVGEGQAYCQHCGAAQPVGGPYGAHAGRGGAAAGSYAAGGAAYPSGGPSYAAGGPSFAAGGSRSASASFAASLSSFQRALDAWSVPAQRVADRVLGVHRASAGVELPLKWYTFNIMFLMWVSALGSFWFGITSMLGSQYGALTDLYYVFMDGMQIVDIVFGALTVLVGVATVYVRQELAHQRRFAPLHFMMLYLLSFVISTVHTLVLTFSFGFGLEILALFPVVAGGAMTALFLYLNKKYFDKRAHIFCC